MVAGAARASGTVHEITLTHMRPASLNATYQAFLRPGSTDIYCQRVQGGRVILSTKEPLGTISEQSLGARQGRGTRGTILNGFGKLAFTRSYVANDRNERQCQCWQQMGNICMETPTSDDSCRKYASACKFSRFPD